MITNRVEQTGILAQSMADVCEGKSACVVGDAALLVVQDAIIQLHGEEALEYFRALMTEFGQRFPHHCSEQGAVN